MSLWYMHEEAQPGRLLTDEGSHRTAITTKGVSDCGPFLMQIKTDNKPKALDVLTGFLHFLEQFHHKVFTMVTASLQLCIDAIEVKCC